MDKNRTVQHVKANVAFTQKEVQQAYFKLRHRTHFADSRQAIETLNQRPRIIVLLDCTIFVRPHYQLSSVGNAAVQKSYSPTHEGGCGIYTEGSTTSLIEIATSDTLR